MNKIGIEFLMLKKDSFCQKKIQVIKFVRYNCKIILTRQYNPEEEKAATFLVKAEEELRDISEQQTFIEWAFESNINDENEKKKLEFQVSF